MSDDDEMTLIEKLKEVALGKKDRNRPVITTISTCVKLQQQILELFLEAWSIR